MNAAIRIKYLQIQLYKTAIILSVSRETYFHQLFLFGKILGGGKDCFVKDLDCGLMLGPYMNKFRLTNSPYNKDFIKNHMKTN